MAEIEHLDHYFGLASDEAIARRLGRTVVGIRLKAKRLGLLKRHVDAISGREVAEIFGVDPTLVSRVWIRRGLLRSRVGWYRGLNRVHLVSDKAIRDFIRVWPQWIDVERMPESPYRDLVAAGGRWLSLPTIAAQTGRHAHVLVRECADGRWPARRRGTHWYVHESQLEAIAATAGYSGRYASLELREANLARRRNVRKGIEAPRPLQPRLLRYRVVRCPDHVDDDCATCQGKGRVLRGLLNGVGIQPLPEAWAA